jgi:hypothetical protein
MGKTVEEWNTYQAMELMVDCETCACRGDGSVFEEAAVGWEYGFPRGICDARWSLGVCLIEL